MADRSHDEFLSELRRRGAGSIRRVIFRHNRTRLLSLSRDRVTLNAHVCFLDAPPEVLDAVARFVTADPRSAGHRHAVAALRSWPGVEAGLTAARERRPARLPTRADCCASPEQRSFLRELYARLNASRFGGALPADIPIRVSGRMSRRLGQVRFDLPQAASRREPATASRRRVLEIALNADLFVEGNDRELLDTLLHEMAHVEAYLEGGHRGHGRAWRTVAKRVGCEARACSRRKIHRRSRKSVVPRRVPVLAAQLSFFPGD